MRFSLLLLLLIFLLSACDFGCVKPGDGVNASTKKVDVPLKISNQMTEEDPATLWIAVCSGVSP